MELMDPDREHDRRPRARFFRTGLLLRGHRLREHGLVAAIAGVFVLSACAGSATTTTQATELPSTPTTELPSTPTTEQVTTTPPVVTIDVRFLLSTVVFGDQGWIEVINTGPQAGNIHGHWIAIHPFYLELPSTIVEVGQTVRVSLDPDADPGVVVGAAGLLPVLVAPGGEVGLYSSGNFGDPNPLDRRHRCRHLGRKQRGPHGGQRGWLARNRRRRRSRRASRGRRGGHAFRPWVRSPPGVARRRRSAPACRTQPRRVLRHRSTR